MPAPIIGFSEVTAPMDNDDILYHVEWLSDEQCFPSLSSTSSINKDNYLDITDWQFIEEKETAEAEHALPGIVMTCTDCLDEDSEAEFWEFIQHAPQKESYAKLVTDAQDRLVGSDPVVYPLSFIHPNAGRFLNKSNNDNANNNDDRDNKDDLYHIYQARKSHGSHSYFGNKNYFKRKETIAYREFWEYWGCGRPEVKPRYLHQCVAVQSHAKQYKPPGPRNANKNKEGRSLKPRHKLEL